MSKNIAHFVKSAQSTEPRNITNPDIIDEKTTGDVG